MDGRLPRGSKLESELDLAERLGFSPSTMPAAMRLLVDKKGLLMGRRGIGTLVAPTLVRRAVALSSLHDDSKEAGRAYLSARTRALGSCQPQTGAQVQERPRPRVALLARASAESGYGAATEPIR